MIKIIIADDHPVVRSGLSALLSSQSDFEIAGEAENGEEAAKLAISLTPDLVLMDLQMPILDGLGAIKLIRDKLPKANILVLTTYETDADIMPALEAGAIGYLLKDTPPEQLFQAIRNAAMVRASARRHGSIPRSSGRSTARPESRGGRSRDWPSHAPA